MKSFDQSLKYLLQHEPADFIRFALADPSVQVLSPLPSGLPSRGRDVDGGYLITRGGVCLVAHVEFHRRHQAAEELAVDVAEAQIRLFRRERLQVLSLVWDLYGAADEPVVERRSLDYGAVERGPGIAGGLSAGEPARPRLGDAARRGPSGPVAARDAGTRGRERSGRA